MERVAAVEDAARLRDALGVSLPRGLPGAFTGSDRSAAARSRRALRTHARTVRAGRAGRTVRRRRSTGSRPPSTELEAEGTLTQGGFSPGGVGHEWCDADVLRRLRQRSLAALRREVEPVEAAAFARFLPAWQGADRPNGASDALVEAIGHLQGAAIPASILETDVLPARVRGYRPADLDAIWPRAATSSGSAPAASAPMTAGWCSASAGRRASLLRDRLRRRARRRCRPRRDPLAPGRARCIVLDRPRAGGRHRRRACAPDRPLGPGVGGRGDERHAGAAPRVRARRLGADPGPAARQAAPTGRAAQDRTARRRRPMVSHRHASSSRPSRPPRPRTPVRCSCSIATAS